MSGGSPMQPGSRHRGPGSRSGSAATEARCEMAPTTAAGPGPSSVESAGGSPPPASHRSRREWTRRREERREAAGELSGKVPSDHLLFAVFGTTTDRDRAESAEGRRLWQPSGGGQRKCSTHASRRGGMRRIDLLPESRRDIRGASFFRRILASAITPGVGNRRRGTPKPGGPPNHPTRGALPSGGGTARLRRAKRKPSDVPERG